MSIYSDILKKYWGYDGFRPLQEDIIRSVADLNQDTLGLLPTGGGKSIIFQVPALSKEGTCIVITPLIALMKDQVENLRRRNIKAAAVYSGMTSMEIQMAFESCIFGDTKFLYMSPERLGTEMFIEKIKQMKISILAIDEAHCISQWGYDFRPSYLKIADVRDLLPDVPVLALTATATPEVADDIMDKLKFKSKNLFRKSFARKNLIYLVRKVADKNSYLLRIFNAQPGTGIVYKTAKSASSAPPTLLVWASTSQTCAPWCISTCPTVSKDISKRRDVAVATNRRLTPCFSTTTTTSPISAAT